MLWRPPRRSWCMHRILCTACNRNSTRSFERGHDGNILEEAYRGRYARQRLLNFWPESSCGYHAIKRFVCIIQVIAVSISNAPLTIWSGSRCIVLQVVRNLPTPNQVQIWFRIATQNSGFLFRRGSNVAKSRRRRNDDHKEKTGETSDSSYRFSCRYLLWGCRGLAPSTSAFNIKPRLNPD